MLLLQQARLMQSKIPRPLKYKVTSIGDKIQRKGIAPTNNKNNKDISTFFVTQHQQIKHSSNINRKNGKIHVQKRPLLLYNGSYKNYQTVFKGFIRRLRSYRMLFHDIFWHVYFKFAWRGLRLEATMRNQFYLK